MGISSKIQSSELLVDELGSRIKELKKQLSDVGVDSAEIMVSADGKVGVKSFNIGNLAIADVAQVDPANIQEVAAAQMGIINSYYRSVLKQAQQSFRWALIAAGVGLLFFLAAVGFLILKQPTNISNISLISGALIEVISAINFYLYGRASNQLASFHVRLDRTQRFLLANSVCENLEGDTKQTARAELVRVIAISPTTISEEQGEGQH